MFGKNKILQPVTNHDGHTLLVNDHFHTIQGEGPFAGRPAYFIRLTGCNLKCYFCDTEFETGKEMPVQDIIADAVKYKQKYGTDLIVLTGGEPLRQPLKALLLECYINGFRVQIETAGTLFQESLMAYREDIIPGWLTIVCSPKTGKVHKLLEPHISAYKYIIQHGDTDAEELLHPDDLLPNESTQKPGVQKKLARPPQGFPRKDIYVQPMDEGYDKQNKRNTKLAAKVAIMKGYTLCLQVHKIAELP